MKKTIIFMLTMGILLGMFGVCQAEGKEIKPTLTNLGEASAQQWYATSTTRALLTVLLALDCDQEENLNFDFAEALMETSYVAYDSKKEELFVLFLMDDRSRTIVYKPDAGTAMYAESDAVSEALAEIALAAICGEYEKNSVARILETVESLNEVGN